MSNQTTPPLDLTPLRKDAETAENLKAGAHVTNGALLALLDLVAELKAEGTRCEISEHAPGICWCKTHDSTYMAGGECDLKGQPVPPERIDRREQRGKSRLIEAEARAEAAEKKLAAVREVAQKYMVHPNYPSSLEMAKEDVAYQVIQSLDGEHTKQLGGTPTGEFADVCSCGKSYWPCYSLDGGA